MTEYTTLKGMDLKNMIDLAYVLVYYGDVYCGYVVSQTISGGKIDFTICWETDEIAEMMQDKLTTAKISIRTVELGTYQEEDDE